MLVYSFERKITKNLLSPLRNGLFFVCFRLSFMVLPSVAGLRWSIYSLLIKP